MMTEEEVELRVRQETDPPMMAELGGPRPTEDVRQYCTVSQNNGSRHGTELLAAGVKCNGDPTGDDAVIKVFNFLRQYTA